MKVKPLEDQRYMLMPDGKAELYRGLGEHEGGQLLLLIGGASYDLDKDTTRALIKAGAKITVNMRG